MPLGTDTPLRSIIGAAATKFAARDLRTAGHLLDFLPRSYLDPKRPSDFSELRDGEYVVVLAVVKQAITRPMRSRRGSLLVATVTDEHGGELDLTFFGSYGHNKVLLPGVRVVCSGTVTSFGYPVRKQLTHPEYQVLRRAGTAPGKPAAAGDQAVSSGYGEGLIPIYPQVKGLTSMKVSAAVDLVLHALGDLPDPLPAEVRLRRGLPALAEAYRLVHQPVTEAEHRKGRWRLKWQEAFVVQAALAQRRRSSEAVPAVPRKATPQGLATQFRERLPFRLTAGQEHVLADITADLARGWPMHRLLQGEVGSGKTVVALLAMLGVVDAGGQAALLAPTEVLAVQHHRSITALLGPLAEGGLLGGAVDGTRVALLTGGQPAGERRVNLLQVASGEAGIVVGTHALIQEQVQFAELGLVVVDEQHRFGVEQRDALRAKAAHSPHVLVMTATPIPRTVAMTVYGDMETSTLRELPQDRQAITTHVVTGDRPAWVQRIWTRVGEEVRAGGQVYVVCPRIGDPDDPDLPHGSDVGPGGPIAADPLADGLEGDEEGPGLGSDGEDASGPSLHGVHQVARALSVLPATRDLRIATMHGRQAAEEKDAVMRAFASGELDMLVATTVIEVGVDVPEATVMVIEDAERFGISQLHQLRGRVGRGRERSYCVLFSDRVDGPEGEPNARLAALERTTDGFQLAEVDLALRGEGSLFATRQSGLPDLKLAKLIRDQAWVRRSRADARALVAHDPRLDGHPLLAAEVARRYGEDRLAALETG